MYEMICYVGLRFRGVNPGGWGGSRPSDFAIIIILGRGVAGGVVDGSWNIISYYVLKCVRKWGLLKRNRIICPEVAVGLNEQFLPGKSNFFKLPEKIENFQNLPG